MPQHSLCLSPKISAFGKFSIALTIVFRWIRLIFKRNRDISCLYFTYTHPFLFQKAYVRLDYHITNGIWYSINGVCRTTNQHYIIVNINNKPKNEIVLTAHGFASSKTYKIAIEPEQRLNTELFSPSIQSKYSAKFNQFSCTLNIQNPEIIEIKKPNLLISKPNILLPKLRIKFKHLVQIEN
jgi:hypothetical protein